MSVPPTVDTRISGAASAQRPACDVALAALLLVALAFAGCTDKPAAPSSAAPTGAPTTAPASVPSVEPEPTPALVPTAADAEKVLWLEEIPGYVSGELALRYVKQPYRFVLYADGRLVMRDDEFVVQERRLDEAEVEELLRAFEATGLSAVEPGRVPAGTGMELLDADAERIGIAREGKARVWEVIGVGFQLKQGSKDPGLLAYAGARRLLRGFGKDQLSK